MTDTPTPTPAPIPASVPANELHDITIIGGGPTGLFAAFYAGMRHAKTKIIDSLNELGGQLSALYPEKYIFDMPGYHKVLAKDLVKEMVLQGLSFNPTVCLGEQVQTLEKIEGVFCLTTKTGAKHWTRTIVIAAGAGAFNPRKLNRPDVDGFEGKGLYYVVPKSLSVFEGQRLLIVGGGDSAVDWALNLHGRAKSITLIHRRPEFRAHEDSVKKMLASSVDVKTPFELRGVTGDSRIRTATVFNNKTNEDTTLEVDAVLLNLGFLADLGPIKKWGLEIKKNDIVVNSRTETNIPGIYACGDVTTFDGKIKLIATGVGEATIAVNHAKAFYDPKAKVFPGHSSEMETFGQSPSKG